MIYFWNHTLEGPLAVSLPLDSKVLPVADSVAGLLSWAFNTDTGFAAALRARLSREGVRIVGVRGEALAVLTATLKEHGIAGMLVVDREGAV